MLKDIVAHMIVVKGSESSEYYANYCIPAWKDHVKDVIIYNAVTPKTLNKYKELKFAKYSGQQKYIKHNLKVEVTETEKSCFQSHFNLWMECCFSQVPLMVLEHDAFLKTPKNLWCDDNCGIIFYDDAAMGAYLIYPWFAKLLVEHCMNNIISTGPYSIIDNISVINNIENKVIIKRNKKFKPAADQVMSKKYGNTIEHYCNLHPEHWPKEIFHKFIEIE